MADIGFDLDELELLIKKNPDSKHCKKLYKQKKEYLDSLEGPKKKPKIRDLNSKELKEIAKLEKKQEEERKNSIEYDKKLKNDHNDYNIIYNLNERMRIGYLSKEETDEIFGKKPEIRDLNSKELKELKKLEKKEKEEEERKNSKELKEIKKLEKKEKEEEERKNSIEYDKKYNTKENWKKYDINKYSNIIQDINVKIKKIKAQPKIEYELIEEALNSGEINEKEAEDLKYGTWATNGDNQLESFREMREWKKNQLKIKQEEEEKEKISKDTNINKNISKKRGRPRKVLNLNKIEETEAKLKLQNKLIGKEFKRNKSQQKFKKNEDELYKEYQRLLERNEELEDMQIEANRKIKENAKINTLYTKLMKDKKIPIEQRQSLKRNTRNGSMATLDELEAFETTRKFVDYDSDSDEEETQADIDKRIEFQMKRKLDRAEWQDKGYQKDLDKIQKEFEKLMKSVK